MPNPGLTDPYLKLNWAKRHLDTLDADLEAFHKSDPCRFTVHDDLESQRHILRIDLDNVPDHISLRCGDAFYCMRSSLDQLVWRLAKLNVGVPGRTQFPIVEKWDDDSRVRFKRCLVDVPGEAVTIIRDLQPANGTGSAKASFLWQLNAMCNLDKHRRIPVHGSQVALKLPTSPDDSLRIEASENHAIFSVPLSEKHKLDFHREVSFVVVFGDPKEVLLGPIEIGEIYHFLSDKLLPRFARFFQQ
jgi:hypothetical protein